MTARRRSTTLAHQIGRVAWPHIDDDYRAALRLFVKEEARHARILGGWVLYRVVETPFMRLRARCFPASGAKAAWPAPAFPSGSVRLG